MSRALTIAALAFTLLACSAGKDTTEPPTELVRIDPVLRIDTVWRASVGDAGEELRLAIAPGSDGSAVYASNLDGEVQSVALDTGRRNWRTDVETQVVAGPAVGDGLVVVSDGEGHVTALSSDAGVVRWRADVAGEVLAAPAIGRSRVVVRTTDGRVIGLDALSGAQVWRIDRDSPPISLRGSGAPVVAGDRVLIGSDTGKVFAVRLDDGHLLWDTPITEPSGATIIQRMVDIDGRPVVAGSEVFAVSYQGRAAMLGLESGQVFWATEANSYRTPAVDVQSLFISSSDGVVQRMDRRSGTPRWEQTALRARTLTSPALHGSSVVVGDFDGYLHWLSSEDGSIQARVHAGGGQVLDPMLVIGDLLICQTRDGKLSAFRINGG